MRRGLKLLFLASLIALPAAADDGFYIGASLGRSGIDTGDVSQIQVSSDANSYKGFAGYRFLKFFGVEGAYADLGSAKVTSATTESQVKMTVFHGEVMGYIPFGIGDIFGKAGAVSWNGDFKTTGGNISSSKSGTDPMYGGGIQFRIKSWAVRGEFEYFDIKDAKHVYMYSVGGSYTF